LRHVRRFHEIIEGRMKGKPTRGRRIQMPHDLANGVGYVALKWATEDREVLRYRERMSKPAVFQYLAP